MAGITRSKVINPDNLRNRVQPTACTYRADITKMAGKKPKVVGLKEIAGFIDSPKLRI